MVDKERTKNAYSSTACMLKNSTLTLQNKQNFEKRSSKTLLFPNPSCLASGPFPFHYSFLRPILSRGEASCGMIDTGRIGVKCQPAAQ